MAFGPIMQLTVNELAIELAPLTKENVSEFVSPGMQHASITKYLHRRTAPVLEDEIDWYEKTRTDSTTLVWGIYVIEKNERVLIGNTSLTDITFEHTIQSISGSMIFRKEYWGKGIASAIHKARTWYVFAQLGHTRIKSAVVHGNAASKKALEKSGYTVVSIERNTVFVDGKLRHQDNLECLNPSEATWRLWWGEDVPTKEVVAARERTIGAMKWAEENVTLL